MHSRWLFALVLGLWVAAAHALTPPQALALAKGENEERIAALQASLARGDDGLAPFVQALLDDTVKLAGDKVFVVRGDKAVEVAGGAEARLPDGAEDVINSNQMRRELEGALAALKLFSPDLGERRAAIKSLKEEADEARLPLIEKALSAEADPGLREQLTQVRAAILVSGSDPARRLDAAKALAGSLTPATKTLIVERLKPAAEGGEADAEVRAQLELALRAIDARLAWGERLGVLFTGVSLGSILLLVALGLAITYGLMGVINMAHGELMMIGAYATYLVQNAFKAHLPGFFDAYVMVAIPASFAGRRAGGRGARAAGDPLALRPAAGNLAGHLGHQPGADAGRALDLRCAERAGGEPVVAVGRRAGAEQPDAAVQPHRHRACSRCWCWAAWRW